MNKQTPSKRRNTRLHCQACAVSLRRTGAGEQDVCPSCHTLAHWLQGLYTRWYVSCIEEDGEPVTSPYMDKCAAERRARELTFWLGRTHTVCLLPSSRPAREQPVSAQ